MPPRRRGRDAGRAAPANGGGTWTANDVQAVLSNPLYVGFRGVPRIIDDGTWIVAQARLVNEVGVHALLTTIRGHLLAQFSSVGAVTAPDWIEASKRTIAADGAEAFFRQLLNLLRQELGWPPGETPAA